MDVISSVKGINRLISNRMPNSYLNVTIEKKLTFSKLQSSESEKYVPSSVFREP